MRASGCEGSWDAGDPGVKSSSQGYLLTKWINNVQVRRNRWKLEHVYLQKIVPTLAFYISLFFFCFLFHSKIKTKWEHFVTLETWNGTIWSVNFTVKLLQIFIPFLWAFGVTLALEDRAEKWKGGKNQVEVPPFFNSLFMFYNLFPKRFRGNS